jgi:ABC-type branched-subunit amino acid transport system substrate-binding protein
MKKVVALVGLTALVAGGCKSTGEDVNSTGTSAPMTVTSLMDDTTGPASTEPIVLGEGVTDASIKIGFTYPDLAAIKDIINLDHGDYLSAFQAIADDINASGGINGRTLQVVDGPVDVTTADAAATTCTKLTEDEKVFAVVGKMQAQDIPCYTEQHNVALVGGQQTSNLLAKAVSPWFAYDAPIDRLAQKTIEGAAAEGAFQGKKVGVVYLAVHKVMMEETVDPALEAASVDVVERALLDVPGDDQTAAAALATTILERFRSEGVDTLLVIGDAFLNMGNALANTDYRPRVIATDANPFSAFLVGRTDVSMLEDSLVGSTPPLEVIWGDEAMQDCVDVIRAAQPDRQISDPVNDPAESPDTFVSVITACQSMSLFVAIAEAAGEGLNNDSFEAAGESLGVFHVPGVEMDLTYTAEAPSGDPPVYLGRFDMAAMQLDVDEVPVP